MSDKPTFTRRGLFRGIGTATLIAGCKPGTDTARPGEDGAAGPGEVGPGPSPVAFELNGKPVTIEVEPRVTLLGALRLDLDTTGPKEVCDRGACGACTVHVDGVPRNACMMLAHDVAGRAVTTVEGLGASESLSVIQRAFVEHDAQQCGFCTSGMLMSASALLRRSGGKKLGRPEVEQALAGNLCRCGTYPHVIAAVIDASAKGGA